MVNFIRAREHYQLFSETSTKATEENKITGSINPLSFKALTTCGEQKKWFTRNSA
jgi:hypothetical protein